MIGKIIADWRGWTEKLGGEKNEKFEPIKEIKTSVSVQKDSWDNFQAEVKAADGNEIKIKAAIDDTKLQQLKNLDGLYDYAVKQSQNGKDVDLGDVNNLIQTQNYQNIASQAHGFSGVNIAIEEYKNSLKKCDDGTTKATANTQKFIDILSTSNSTLADCMTKANGSSIGMGDYAKSLAAATVKTFALEAATMALNAGVSYGISAIISGIVTAIVNYANRIDDAIEASQRAKETIDNANSSFESQQKLIKESGNRYAELAQHVNQLNNTNLDLKEEEYNEFLDISNQIAEQFPSLIKGYDDNGNAILNLNGNVSTINSTLGEYIKKAEMASKTKIVQAFKGEGDNDDYFKGAKYEVDDLNNKAKDEKKNLENLYKIKNNKLSTDNDMPDLFGNYSPSSDIRIKIDNIRDYLEDSNFDVIFPYHLDNDFFGKLSFDEQNELSQALKSRSIDGRFSDEAILTFDKIYSKYSSESGYNFSDYITQQIKTSTDNYNQFAADVVNKNKEIAQNAQVVLENSVIWSYQDTTERMKTTMTNSLNRIDWSDKQFEEFDGEKAANYIQTTFTSYFEKLSPDDKIAVDNFFATDPNNMDLSRYISMYEKIKSIFDEQGINLPINIEDVQNIQDTFNKSLEGMSTEDQEAVKKYLNEHSIDTASEIDVWNKRTEGINNATGAIQAYEKKAEEVSKQSGTSSTTFKEAWDSLGTEETDGTRKTALEAKQELLDLAEAGKLTAEAFENSSIAEQFMRNTGLSAEEAANKVNALVEETKQLSAMRTGITAITAAYDEKKENRETSNVVSPDTLSSMYSTLGVSEWDDESAIQSWEKYKKAAGESSTTLKELKAAQDNLAASYINSNNFLSNLTGTNQDYYKSILSEMGITNAAAIVTNTLRQRQADLAVETYNALDSERKTQDELDKVEEKLKGCTKKEKEYYFAKLLANRENIDTEAERNQLILLAEKLQIDCDMVDALQGKLLNFDGMTATATAKVAYKTESGTSNDINGYNVNTDSHSGSMAGKTNSFFANGANSAKKTPKAQLLASQELNGLKNSIKADSETPKGNKANGTKSDSTSNKSTKTEIDWIERGITRLTSKISLFNAQKENIFTVKKKNANLNKQITQTTKLINTYRAAITKYTKKANSIDLSDSLKKKIRNGQISGSYKSLIKKYDEKDAEKIQLYQNWYDKSKAAKQSLAEAKADKRALQEQQYQNYVDLYDSRTSRAEAKEAATVGSANQNKAVETQIRNTELSYDYQIRIASELYKDKAKADTLEYEKQKAIVELKKQQVENIKAEYDNRINLLNSGDASKGMTGVKDLQNAISLLEARGQRVSGSYYRSQNGMQKENLKKQTEERKALAARLSQFKNGSQEWYDIQADIQSLDDSINSIKIEIANNNKAILELRDAIYEEIRERDKAISTEVSNIAGLIHGDNVDNNNNLTEAWYAKMGAAGISLKTSLGGYDSDHSLYSAIQRAVAGGKEHAQTAVDESGNTVYRIKAGNKTYDYNSWDDLAADEQKYAALVMQDIQAEYDAEQQIIDLMKEKYQTQLDFLKDIIDAKKELLQENKELYDYEKSISEKTKSIAEIQKQLNALKGDTSEEGRAKRSQLQTQFDESQEDLQDTEWEHALSVQQNMLDNLYEEYQDLMNDLFYDQNKLLRQGIDSINDNGLKIEKILNKTAESYGYATTTDADKVISALGTSHTAITSVADSLNGETGEVGKAIISINNKIGGEDKSSAGSGSGSGSDDLLADENHKARQDSQIVSVNGTTTTLGESKEKEREGLLRAARSFIGVNASKAKKKRDSYSYVNQKIYDSTNGKVLSVANLKKLAEKTLKVSYNGAGKDGSLAKKLKEIKYTGFRTGGIVRANNVPSNGDYIPIRVNPNETILTQKFTDMLPNTVSIMENFTKAIQIPDYTKITTPNTGNKISYGDFHFDIELPNVTDSDSFVREMQNSPKVRKMFTVAFDDLAKSGRLTNNIQGIK